MYLYKRVEITKNIISLVIIHNLKEQVPIG